MPYPHHSHPEYTHHTVAGPVLCLGMLLDVSPYLIKKRIFLSPFSEEIEIFLTAQPTRIQQIKR